MFLEWFDFIYPLLLYGVEVYANTTYSYLSKLIILNNKLLHIVQQKPIGSHNIELYLAYNTLTLELLHNYQMFFAYFDENKTVRHHNTRQCVTSMFTLFILN